MTLTCSKPKLLGLAAVLLSAILLLAGAFAGVAVATGSDPGPLGEGADGFVDTYRAFHRPVYTDTLTGPWYQYNLVQRPGDYDPCPLCWELRDAAFTGAPLHGNGTQWTMVFTVGQTSIASSANLSIILTDQYGNVDTDTVSGQGKEEYFTLTMTLNLDANVFYNIEFSANRWILELGDVTGPTASPTYNDLPYCTTPDTWASGLNGWQTGTSSASNTGASAGHTDLGAITWPRDEMLSKEFSDITSCIGLAFWTRGYDDLSHPNVFTVTIDSTVVYTGLATSQLWTRHIIPYTFSSGSHDIAIGGMDGNPNKNTLIIDDLYFYSPEPTPTPSPIPPTPSPTPNVTPTPVPEPTVIVIIIPGDSGGGDPLPIGDGTGSTCYICNAPGTLEVSYWIAWLACILSNLFGCNLRVWLLGIENAVIGVINYLSAIIIWWPATTQAGISWASNIISSWAGLQVTMWNYLAAYLEALPAAIAIGGGSDLPIDLGDILEFLLSILDLVIGLAAGLLNLLRWIVDLVLSLVDVLIAAFQAEPYQFDFLYPTDPGRFAALQANLNTVGNELTVYIVFMWGMMTFDDILNSLYFSYWQYVLIGILAFMLLPWLLKQWRDLVPSI